MKMKKVAILVALLLMIPAVLANPTKDSVTPGDGAVVGANQNFVYDFASDAESDLAYLELDIYGPAGFNSGEKFQGTLPADNSQIESIDLSQFNVNSASYNSNTETWEFELATCGDFWIEGDYTFYVEVGDTNGGKWGDMNNNPDFGGLKSFDYTVDCTQEEIPEFGILGAVAVLGLAGLFIARRRK